MNKLIITCLMIFIYSNVIGQIENYLEYQKQINNAELNLIRGNKEEALKGYYTTLNDFQGNYCKDIVNALFLCQELSKTDTFFEILEFLHPKGLDNSYLNENFNDYIENPQWKDFLNRNRNHPNINKSLAVKIDSLKIKDQFFRIKEGSYNVYQDTINKIDSMNMEFLFELVANNEFPGEDEIGVKNFSGHQGFDIVFHHYTQATSRNSRKEKITPILVNLVLEGKILPSRASYWMELQNGEFKTGVFDVINFLVEDEKTAFYVPRYNKQEKLIINQYREWLGMENLDEYYEKFLFKINNPNSKYLFDIQTSTFEIDRETMVKFTSNMIKLE